MDERPINRRFPRMTSARPIAFRPLDGDPETTSLAITGSIGLGGLMFETDLPPVQGERYAISLDLPDGPLRLVALVVYRLPLEKGLYKVGMEFVDPDPEAIDRLETIYLREEHLIDGE